MARTEAQAAAARTNGALSKGPVTTGGKYTSSLNAFTHGVYARALLPGEDPSQFHELGAQYVAAFEPKNVPEMRVVEELAALDLRGQRLAAYERGILMSRLDQHVQETHLFRLRHQTGNALICVRAMTATVQEVAPRPTVAGMALFIDGLEKVIAMLGNLEGLAPVHVVALERAAELLTADGNGNTVDPQCYHELVPVLRGIEEALEAKLLEEGEQLEDLKKTIASTQLLLTGEDIKKLDRYRRYLEQATARQLELLKAVRSSSVETGESEDFRLRIVK